MNTPTHLRHLPRWGMVVLALCLTACGHWSGQSGCSSACNTAVPDNGPPRLTTHLIQLPLTDLSATVAVPPPSPSGTLLYPWRVPPLALPPALPAEALPVRAAAPALAHAAPMATEAPRATRPPERLTSRAKTRPQTAPRTKQRLAPRTKPRAAPMAQARTRNPLPVQRSETAPRTQRRTLAKQPLDCPNLQRTNPFLAEQLRCPNAPVSLPPATAPR